MIVACPHCAAVYELPRHLLGPGGAAVRCPHCTGEFTLGADGEVISGAGAHDAAVAPPAPAPAATRTGAAAQVPAAAQAPAHAPAAARTAAPATASAAASVAEPAAKPARKPTPQRSPATQVTPATQSSAARAPAAAAVAPAEEDSARAIARRVLDELVARKGTAMKDANARGRLLSEFGPDLIAAFDAFRKESGLVSPAQFRDELLGRFGIDLRPRAD